MHEILLSNELREKELNIVLSCIECNVKVKETPLELLEDIKNTINNIRNKIEISEISKINSIYTSRQAYKKLGKDPSRYRLSAEALLRRVIKEKDLYKINNIVDLLNLVSITYGYSIGGYDSDKIDGTISFDIGKENELYKGIGRGDLNIHNLPVFRDETGSFGTPTSDSIRTMVTNETKKFLMVIVSFGCNENLNNSVELAKELLYKYANAFNFEIYTIN